MPSDQENSLNSTVRAAAKALIVGVPNARRDRLEICRRLLERDPDILEVTGWAQAQSSWSQGQWFYAVGALYMLLMPPLRRSHLAAYFTPPHICDFIFGRLKAHGINFHSDRFLDPAAGGAAFLVPMAELISQSFSDEDGLSLRDTMINNLSGYEIESGLAKLSNFMIEKILKSEPGSSGHVYVRCANSLKESIPQEYEVVVSNPPYGRVFRPSKKLLQRWGEVVSLGHVNTYALFAKLAIDAAKPGGLVALVIPTSFLSGPYFSAIRSYVLNHASVLDIGSVLKRSEEFIDVIQDTCVIILRKSPKSETSAPRFYIIDGSKPADISGEVDLPTSGDRPWVVPEVGEVTRGSIFNPGFQDLSAYGYKASVGNLVWNRSQDRLFEREEVGEGEVPLIWAHGVRTGELARSTSKRHGGAGLFSSVSVNFSSPAIIREDSIVIQRTSNRLQPRRIVASKAQWSDFEAYGGYLTENHTIVIKRDKAKQPLLDIDRLLQLLVSSAVDRRFRRVCNTASISAKILQSFPLPSAQAMKACWRDGGDIDAIVEDAYEASRIS